MMLGTQHQLNGYPSSYELPQSAEHQQSCPTRSVESKELFVYCFPISDLFQHWLVQGTELHRYKSKILVISFSLTFTHTIINFSLIVHFTQSIMHHIVMKASTPPKTWILWQHARWDTNKKASFVSDANADVKNFWQRFSCHMLPSPLCLSLKSLVG